MSWFDQCLQGLVRPSWPPCWFTRCSALHVQVTRQQVGKGGMPYIATHDGRTIRYPDPDIRVSLPAAAALVLGCATA